MRLSLISPRYVQYQSVNQLFVLLLPKQLLYGSPLTNTLPQAPLPESIKRYQKRQRAAQTGGAIDDTTMITSAAGETETSILATGDTSFVSLKATPRRRTMGSTVTPSTTSTTTTAKQSGTSTGTTSRSTRGGIPARAGRGAARGGRGSGLPRGRGRGAK